MCGAWCGVALLLLLCLFFCVPYMCFSGFVGVLQDVPRVYGGSELVHRVQKQTAVAFIELVEEDDQRASQCPAGQRLLRVAGGRDQVGVQSLPGSMTNWYLLFWRPVWTNGCSIFRLHHFWFVNYAGAIRVVTGLAGCICSVYVGVS